MSPEIPEESKNMQLRRTVFSPCRKYRYTLWREWGNAGVDSIFDSADTGNRDRYLMVIGLNPSTADETKDDPTIRKCIGFAKRWGFDALCMTNLFAWRDTKPEAMKRQPNPAGEDQQHWLLHCASEAGMVLAAWGKHGSFRNQDINVQQWLSTIGVKLHCLKPNSDGSPMHPLYVPYETVPVEWPVQS